MAHKKVIAFSILLLNLFCYNSFAKKPDDTKSISVDTTQTCLIDDDPIIRMLDSLSLSSYFNNSTFTTDTAILNKEHFPKGYIPVYSDSIYNERIKKLNQNTLCNLFYNADVKKYIEIYAGKKRNLTSRVLGLAQLYFPVFESILDKYNIPIEIKYLAIVESALNPLAVSRARAAGLWQFIPGTGKFYNLKVSYLVDDRFNIYKATEAACKHMRDLYNMFHNWELVLAAYNSGSNCVNRAIARSGGKKTFLEIKRFLPRETQAYVPAFIAVNYIMNYATEHNIYPTAPALFSQEIDTVTIRKQLTFEQISEVLKIPYENILLLNPCFRKGIIPAGNGVTFKLRLPKEQIATFINNEEALYSYKAKNTGKLEQYARNNKNDLKNGYHTVRKGETLSKIANKYNCSLSELKEWNKLKSNSYTSLEQKLLVFNPKDEISYKF